jgi:ribonuclease Z
VDESTEGNNYLKVTAAPIRHTVPCVGYVVEDLEFRDRNLKLSSLKDIVESNSEALEKIYRIKERVYNVIKLLGPGETFTFPDGTVVWAEDVLHDAIPSRKIVIMGDTCDGSDIAPFAAHADLLVHEATLAHFPEYASHHHPPSHRPCLRGREEEISYAQFERLTRERGHSTPNMAGRFAARIGIAPQPSLLADHRQGPSNSS